MGLGPLPPVPGWLKVSLRGFIDNLNVYPWENICHFAFAGSAPSDATCTAIAGLVRAAWTAHMAAEQPSPSTLTEVQVTDLTSDSAGQGTDLTVISGTRGDDSIPANAATLVSYPATTRYRGGHPRNYLYVLGNADLDGAAEWADAAVAEVASHWFAFLTACEAISSGGTSIGTFGTVRFYGQFLPNSGPPRYRLDTPVPIPINIADLLVAKEMASQRRRIGRRKS